MSRTKSPREVIRFTDGDVGKKVLFSPHENSIIYEMFLEGKSGTIKTVTNCSFDQQIVVDFNYLLQFSPHASVTSAIFKTSDRDLVIKSIKNRKVTFCQGQPEWNSKKNVPVHGMSLSEIGGKQFDFVEEKNFSGGVYFDCPTTQLKYVYSYYHYPPIGPEFRVSGDNLIFSK